MSPYFQEVVCLDLLCNDFYLDEITKLYQNYLDKFKSDIVDEVCKLDEKDFILCESDLVIYDSICVDFPFEDDLLYNKLPSPDVYLSDLIKKKVDYNFKGLCDYGVDRSYLNRILRGNVPSKNTLVSIGYFLNLSLDEMSELFNVYGFAFGNSLDDRVIYYAFKNSFSYCEFLELVEVHGSRMLNKFFMK